MLVGSKQKKNNILRFDIKYQHFYNKVFLQAVKLAPSNMRSLYGLLLTCTQLAASPKCQQAKKKDYAKVRYEKEK